MSSLAELSRRLGRLKEISSVMTAMKSLSLVETRKLARFIGYQRRMLTNIEAAAADFLHFFPLPDAIGETQTIVPLLGALDPARLSLPVLTLVLAGLDAFNPCAFFVLLFLMSMMAHQKSRTRLLTLGDLSPAVRYGYLAAYNLIYVLPLAAIVAVFAGSLGVRKLSEREGRLLKLMSGAMMLELGALLLLAPGRVSQVGIAFGLLAAAVGITYLAARFGRAD